MTKEILFASRKGGTGKSTLCAMVANHLANNGMKVAVIDCDNCYTLTWRRKSDMKILPEGENPKYPILTDDDYFDKEHEFDSYDYVLIDNYDMVSEDRVGVLIIPFIYSEMVLDSTFRFIRYMKRVGGSELVFLPNEVSGYKQSIKKKDINENINWILGIFGKILPKVSNSRLMDQVNTIANTVEQNLLIRDFVNELIPECPMSDEEITIGEEDAPSGDGPQNIPIQRDLFEPLDTDPDPTSINTHQYE